MSALGAKLLTNQNCRASLSIHCCKFQVFFLTSNVFDESRFTWRCFGEMPRATDKSSAPCTQVVAEPEMEPNTELRVKHLKPKKSNETEKCSSNRLGI